MVRRLLRPALLVVVAILVLVAVGFAALRGYVGTHGFARQVGSDLSRQLGAEVETGSVSLGVFGTSIGQVAFREAGAPAGSEPWARAERIDAAAPFWSLAAGALPSRLTLHAPDVTLRFAADGSLLTRLPTATASDQPMPAIRFERARVTILQEGRPPMVVSGATGSVDLRAGQLVLAGTVADPTWGDWMATGSLDRATLAGSVSLKTTRHVHATPDLLGRIAFVSPAVWEQVRLEGDTTAELTITHQPGSATPVAYHVEARPTDTSVFVSSIDLHASHASGIVLVDGGLVTLKDVKGTTADGELRTDATLDFRGEKSVLHFDVAVQRVTVENLPKSWHLPEQIHGRLDGDADLTVSIQADGVRTDGTGKGQIREAVLVPPKGKPIPLARPIDLALTADANGFDVRPVGGMAGLKKMPAWIGILTGGLLVGPGDDFTAEGEAPAKPAEPPAPAAPAKPERKPTYFEASFSLKDVELSELLKDFEVKTPVTLTGRFNFDARVAFPVDSPSDLKAYRFNGTVSSPRLTIEQAVLEQVKARVRYEGGIIRLEELAADIPAVAAGQPAGTVRGSASYGVIPEGALTAKLTLANLPVAQLMRVAPDLAEAAGGTVSGQLDFTAPAGGLRDPATWNAAADLTTAEAKAVGWRLTDARADLKLAQGLATITNLKGRLEGTPVEGNGEVRLTEKSYPWKAHATVKGADLAAFGRLDKQIRPKSPPAGTLDGTADARGTLLPLTADLDLNAPKLNVRGIPTRQLKGTAHYRDGAFDYNLNGNVFGGKFVLEGKYPPSDADTTPPAGKREEQEADEEEQQLPRPKGETFLPGVGRFALEGVDLGAILREYFGPNAPDLSGRLNLEVRFRPDARGQSEGVGRFQTSSIRLGTTELVRQTAGDVFLRGTRLALRRINLDVGGGAVRGWVTFDLAHAGGGRARITLEQVPAERVLAAFPDLAGVAEGPIDGRFDTRFGDHIAGEGVFQLIRGRIASLPVSDVRLPLTWNCTPGFGSGDVTAGDVTGNLAGGRLTGRAEYHFGASPRLSGSVRFRGVDARALVRRYGGPESFGVGQAVGRIDFSGSDVRSVDDISATFQASLGSTQAAALPVIGPIVDFLNIASLTQSFDEGELRGGLSRGVIRLRQFSLKGRLASLWMDGTITLRGGRLDLNAVAATNQFGIDTRALRLFGLRIPAELGPVPVALVVEVTEYLSNRVISLEVTGTLRSPVIRIRPLRTLTDEAVRFFVGRVIPVAPQGP